MVMRKLHMHADEITEAFADWHRALTKLHRLEEELAQARASADAPALERLAVREKELIAECDAALERTTELMKRGSSTPRGDKPH